MDFYECTWQNSLFNLWLWFTRLAFLLLLLLHPINPRSGSLHKIQSRLMFSEERDSGGCSNFSRFFLWKTCFFILFNFFFGVGQHLYKSRALDTSHQGCTLVQNCMMKAAAFCLRIVLRHSRLHGGVAAAAQCSKPPSDWCTKQRLPCFLVQDVLCACWCCCMYNAALFFRTRTDLMELSCAGREWDGGRGKPCKIWGVMHMQWGVALGSPNARLYNMSELLLI